MILLGGYREDRAIKILHFADLHLGVETYGRINPETGVSTRLDDFLAALDKVVDYALEESIDLVLFCGDAYKSREPSQTQQREFARRINRLSSGGVPVFLVVGNHDMPNAIGKATATEIFHTLEVANVYVSNKPEIYRIETKSGIIQVASLPWLRRSAMLSREETKNLSLEQINEKMQQVLTNQINLHASNLDPSLPAVLAAHVGVASATVGSERLMAIGHEHFLLPGNIANPAFDYIALGHIHKHQVLNENPPVVYAGSLERVDFGEENDEKGFYTVDIGPDTQTGGRKVSYEFHRINGRRFQTINVEIKADDADPTMTVLNAIQQSGEDGIGDAIVRLQISLPSEAEGEVRDSEIRESLKGAYYSTVGKNVERETRLRLGQTPAEEIAPIEALKTYLEANYPPERAKILLEYGERLIQGENGQEV
ncbi:exonuclease SbcCD subunit D [Chloroflexota bacterium]